MTYVTDLPQIYSAAQKAKVQRKTQRYARPLVRLWDGNWVLRGVSGAEVSADFRWTLNDTGVGVLVLPYDYYLARWAMDIYNDDPRSGRTTQNIHITVDKDGARWDGRLEKAVLKTDEQGTTTVELSFLHSYEELKHIICWSNPFLPEAVQFPREFMLAGPSIWVLKTALMMNLLRLQGSSWAVPSDPMDSAQWGNLNMSNWQIAVKPTPYGTDNSVWTIFGSRFKNWHECASGTLQTGELMVQTRRWLNGDPLPWPGANLRHGCLVVDIVDKSGFTSNTARIGDVWGGLQHMWDTFEKNADGVFYDQIEHPLPDPNIPAAYRTPGYLGTLPSNPWVVYRQNDHCGIQTSQFIVQPSSAVQVVTGGHSAPGVNEAISSAIQFVGFLMGGILGEVPFAGPILSALAEGATEVVNVIAMALFTDTLLAWQRHYAVDRAQASGWSHYFEHFETSADRAYTLGALLSLGEGMWKTRTHHTHKLTVANGEPYLIGDAGQGHFFLGDRVGSTIKGMPAGKIYVDQVTELELAWSRNASPQWQITLGTDKDHDMPFAQSMRIVADIVDELMSLAVQM
ncbi:phage tail protein [Nocardia sp. NBC_01503]|uniref:Gp37-like protein n=1 Tax=Nocardia sp. NBC_01503 TaxID=2975997 RepID=UPI002E7BF69A|nr:phage tail protein [Nocardia sp. NBC_01503]WTL35619.1 phage tail protein [Nocardia sp. NBC_01503]